MLKLLILWDIYGRKGRKTVAKHIGALKEKYAPDFLVANSENIASGYGPNIDQIEFMQNLGFDILTSGNHGFRNMSGISHYLNSDECIQLRPANYHTTKYFDVPGVGHKIIEKDGKKLLVINVLGQVFMRDDVANPFIAAEEIIEQNTEQVDGVIVDFHKETTSEGNFMAHFLDGKASFVYGTHTHVQTNDERILSNGTGFINDIGFTGVQNSLIGNSYESRELAFLTGIASLGRGQQELEGWTVLYGCYIEIENLKCTKIEKIRIES